MATKAGLDPYDTRLCFKIEKSLYGTPQAGRNWNKDINKALLDEGFLPFQKDPCIYIRTNPDGSTIILGLYVDDLLICSKNDNYLKTLIYNLNKKYKLNDLGIVTKFLGIRFKQSSDRLEMDLEEYIDKMLYKFNMSNCTISEIPALTSIHLSKQHCASTEEEINEMLKVPYRQLIGSLLFACTTLVPEIAAAVSKLSEFMNNPGPTHWREAKRVLQYLKGVKHEKFTYYKDNTNTTNKYTLYGYTDADWAANRDNRRSRTGYVFKLGTSLISWASMMQPTVALSSAESELMSATHAAKQCIYIRDLLKFLNVEQKYNTIIFEDNNACIRLSKNSEFHKRTKHIDIRWFYIREKYVSGEINLVHVNTKDNIADLFTKPLGTPTFKYLISKMYECNIE
jgi:hypothetical protein